RQLHHSWQSHLRFQCYCSQFESEYFSRSWSSSFAESRQFLQSCSSIATANAANYFQCSTADGANHNQCVSNDNTRFRTRSNSLPGGESRFRDARAAIKAASHPCPTGNESEFGQCTAGGATDGGQ